MASKPLTGELVESLTEGLRGKEYPQFDGTAYATIPAWTPSSTRATEIVRFRRDFDDGVARNLTGSADTGADGIRISTANAPSVVYLDATNTLQFATGVNNSIGLGVDHEIRAEFYPDRVECWLDGVLAGTSLVAPKQAWLRDYIGATAPATENFIGPIFSYQLIDHTPLQGIRAMGGNGVDRYAAIPEITLAGDFEVEFDCTIPATNNRLLGDVAAADSRVFVSDTIIALYDQTESPVSASHNKGVGQKVKFSVAVVGSSATFKADGVEIGSASITPGNFTVDAIYRQTSGYASADSVFANLRIHDLETGREYTYDNANDSGNKLRNTSDPSGATDGTWFQGGVEMTNAAADAARAYLPMISRHYLFDTPGRIREVLGGDGPELTGGDLSGFVASATVSPATINPGSFTTVAAATGVEFELEPDTQYRLIVAGVAVGFTVNLADDPTATTRTQIMSGFGDVIFTTTQAQSWLYLRLENVGTAMIDSISIRETSDATPVNLDASDWQPE